MDLKELKPQELLKLHAEVAEELRRRGIVRSANNPTGDLGEDLFCKAFGWTQSGNSNANLDAVCPAGVRYQIKARRATVHNKSRQLSAIRNLDGQHFDFLAAVLFDENYNIVRAALVPHEVVRSRATFRPHTNSHKFILRDDVWTVPGVKDVTALLRQVNL
jgi:hypothetical protein